MIQSYLDRYTDNRSARKKSPLSNNGMYGGPPLQEEPRESLPRRETLAGHQRRVVPQIGSYAGSGMSQPGNAGTPLNREQYGGPSDVWDRYGTKAPAIIPSGIPTPYINADLTLNQSADVYPGAAAGGAAPDTIDKEWPPDDIIHTDFDDEWPDDEWPPIDDDPPPDDEWPPIDDDPPPDKEWSPDEIIHTDFVDPTPLDDPPPPPPPIDDEPPLDEGPPDGVILTDFDDEPPPIDDEPPPIDDEPPPLDDEPPPLDDEPPPLDDEPPSDYDLEDDEPKDRPDWANIYPQYEPTEGELNLQKQIINALSGRLAGQGLSLTPEELQSQYSTQFEDLARSQSAGNEGILQLANRYNTLKSGTTIHDLAENTLGYDTSRRNIISDVMSKDAARKQDEMNNRIGQTAGYLGYLDSSRRGQYSDYLSGIQTQQGLDSDAFYQMLMGSQFNQSEEQRNWENLFNQADWERQGYYNETGLGLGALGGQNQDISDFSWLFGDGGSNISSLLSAFGNASSQQSDNNSYIYSMLKDFFGDFFD